MAEPGELYDERYADAYRELYIAHPVWAAKHARNVENLRQLVRPGTAWLDTCCGQAWHFTQIAQPGVAKLGVDASAAQLARARAANPNAAFLEGDILGDRVRDALAGDRFHVVSNFWGAYAYLADEARIAELVRRLIAWTAPGGALYLELLTPETLAAFDESPFAREHGFSVELLSPDGVRWRYRDVAGVHDMTSPPHAYFVERLAPWFARVEDRGVVATMRQLVATGRLR